MAWTDDRARLARLHKGPNPDDAAILDARRALRISRAEAYLADLLDAAPPLIIEQRDRLAGMLLSGGEPA